MKAASHPSKPPSMRAMRRRSPAIEVLSRSRSVIEPKLNAHLRTRGMNLNAAKPPARSCSSSARGAGSKGACHRQPGERELEAKLPNEANSGAGPIQFALRTGDGHRRQARASITISWAEHRRLEGSRIYWNIHLAGSEDRGQITCFPSTKNIFGAMRSMIEMKSRVAPRRPQVCRRARSYPQTERPCPDAAPACEGGLSKWTSGFHRWQRQSVG